MKILRQLSEAIGVSGEEGEVRQLILDLIRPHVSEIITDTMGNVIAYKPGHGPEPRPKVLIDAHMDEVGLMVNGYTSSGMLKFAPIGGIDDRILPGLRVLVGKKKFPGVIGVKPIHLLEPAEVEKVPNRSSLTIDIGTATKAAAEGKAPLGTRVGFDSRFADLGTVVRGRAFDDRAGCAVLIHLLQGDPYPFDLIASFTVQEEIGVRGAAVAAYRATPDIAICLEGTIADDLPKEDDESPTTALGKGPAISVMDRGAIYDRSLNDHLIATAASLGIPYQIKQPGIGGTNARAINQALSGVRIACVAVPCRYIHGPLAMLNKRDYQQTIQLMRAALAYLPLPTG